MRYELFAADELAPGSMRSVKVGGVSVAVIRTPDGTLHALRDVCSHMGARLSDGRLHPAAAAEHGGYRLSEDFVVSCPWHGFEFSVDTGHCLADARHRCRTYKITQENGMIVLER